MLLKCEVTSGLITLPLGAGLLFFLVESLTRAGDDLSPLINGCLEINYVKFNLI